METTHTDTHPNSSMPPFKPQQKSRLGKILGGLVIVTAGAFLLARNAGVPFPEWLFSVPVFLFTLGLFFWSRHTFRNPFGLILMFIGSFMLIGHIFPSLFISQFFWPLIIMAAGTWMIFKPRRKCLTAQHIYTKQRCHQRRYN